MFGPRLAILAALLLSGCTNSASVTSRDDNPPPSPGEVEVPGSAEIGYGRIGDTVTFDTDSAVLSSTAQSLLQKQAAWLTAFAGHRVIIEGHADERGTREYNLALGERRARAVMDYLIALGIAANRLKTISYGKERPICTEPNEACWNRNRRTVTTLDD